MDDDKTSRIESLKAAAKARLLEKFDRDWADAERLAAAYPDLFMIVPGAAPQQSDASKTEAKPQTDPSFDGTVKGLIDAYKRDTNSGYNKARFRTRQNYDWLLRSIEHDLGSKRVADLDAYHITKVHESWKEGGRIAKAHGLVTMLRALSTFGATWLKSPDCRELRSTLSGMEFQMPTERREQLTAEHAKAIRAKAHELGYPSIALAQAFQFDCRLPQKDVIGEWVPISEPGTPSDVIDGEMKWRHGLRWSEIDEDLILRHPASNGGRVDPIPLTEAQMVMTELTRITRRQSGPMIVYERTGKPYLTYQFRRVWRIVADAAGVPRSVYNMDSRAPARLDRLSPSRRPRQEKDTESAR